MIRSVLYSLFCLILISNAAQSLSLSSVNDVCWSYVVGVDQIIYPQVQCGYNQICSGTCYFRYCVTYEQFIDKQLDQTQCPNNYWYSPQTTVSPDDYYDYEDAWWIFFPCAIAFLIVLGLAATIYHKRFSFQQQRQRRLVIARRDHIYTIPSVPVACPSNNSYSYYVKATVDDLPPSYENVMRSSSNNSSETIQSPEPEPSSNFS